MCQHRIILSKESFIDSLQDKLFSKTELGKEQLNDDIYDILTDCRSKLFRNIFENNKDTFENNSSKLMEVGQKLIDRFVFIRFCEDNQLFGKKGEN